MEANLKKTSYWSADSWQNYEEARPALEVALRALDRVGFPAYWSANAKPRIEKRIAELSPQLPKYDIIPVIESYLGFPLPSHTITVYLLAYSEPHGIRITGLRFLTHVFYPFYIVLHNAIHEPMHPPYHADDPKVREAIDLLGRNPLVIDKVQHHDPSFGYNTTAGYIEEDSVQALEQIVSEKFGIGRDACQYWREQDDGMHVLAVAIYTGYKQALSRDSRDLFAVVHPRGRRWAAPRQQPAANHSVLLFISPLPLTRRVTGNTEVGCVFRIRLAKRRCVHQFNQPCVGAMHGERKEQGLGTRGQGPGTRE